MMFVCVQAELRAAVFLALEEQDKVEVTTIFYHVHIYDGECLRF